MKYSTNLQSTFGKRQKNPQSALCHSTPQHDKCSRSDEKKSSKHLLFSTCQTGTALTKRRVRGIYPKNSIMLMQSGHGMDILEKILLRGCVISDISQPDAFDNKLLHSLNIKEGRKKKKNISVSFSLPSGSRRSICAAKLFFCK